MSTLVVDYGMESSFRKSIKSAKSALNKRVDDYENNENRARNIPSNTNNCSNCAYYVKRNISSSMARSINSTLLMTRWKGS